MTRYCTYFDQGYLANGLALWATLRRVEPDARLVVLALDDLTAEVLAAQPSEGLRVLRLDELLAGDPALAEVRAHRPGAEFFFTLTPCLVGHLLAREPADGPLVYVDADIGFFGPPGAILADLGAGSILVYEHRFPAWHDDAARYGRFNVGVLAFRPDDASRACVAWWRERCLESCALDADRGVYGDQKYLDEWPARFPGVVVGRHPGVNLAPWNWAAHRLTPAPAGLEVDGQPLVAYHFAQFRRIAGGWFASGQLEYGVMPRRCRAPLHEAYWQALRAAEASIRSVRPGYTLPARGWRATLWPPHLGLLRLAWGEIWWRGGGGWWAGRFGLGRFSGHFLAWYRRLGRRAAP